MNDGTSSARGFVKGPRRASFSSPPLPASVARTPRQPDVNVPTIEPAPGSAPTPVLRVPVSLSPPAPVAEQRVVPSPVVVPVADIHEGHPIDPPISTSISTSSLVTRHDVPNTTNLHHTKSKGGKSLFYSLLGVLAVSVSCLGYQMYHDSQQKLQQLATASPEAFSEFENDALYAKVNRHMILPNEKPLVRTVSEADKLKNEPFYAQAHDGDKVLVFSRRAILYSPSQDRIVEIGFIRDTSPTPVANATAPTESSPSGGPAVAGASTGQ